MKWWASAVFLLASMSAQAKSGTQRLDGPGTPLSRVSVRAQNGLGICYAETAAQLFDAYRALGNSNPFQETSAVALGVEYNAQPEIIADKKKDHPSQGLITPSPWDGGNTCDTFNFLVRVGGIPLSEVDETALSATQNRAGSTLLDNLGGNYEYFLEQLDRSELFATVTHVYPRAALARDAIDRVLGDPKKGTNDFILAAIQGNPVERTRIQGAHTPECKTQWVAQDPSIRKTLTEYFNSATDKTLPLGISFCSRIFTAPSSYRGLYDVKRNAQGEVEDFKRQSDCGPHAALLTGLRTTRFGKRQYLIRNSWGTSPWYIDGFWGEERKERYYSRSLKFESQTGSVWVDAGLLEANLVTLDRIL